MDAWRQSYTKKLGADASCVDIAKFAQSHSADQMEGLQKPVRGKLQEIMESTYENGDNDEWSTSISDSFEKIIAFLIAQFSYFNLLNPDPLLFAIIFRITPRMFLSRLY